MNHKTNNNLDSCLYTDEDSKSATVPMCLKWKSSI